LNDALTQEQLIDLAEHYSQQWLANSIDYVLYALVLAVGYTLFRSAVENIAGFITFRADRYVKQGTVVIYDETVYRIKSVNWTSLVLESKTGFLSLPIKRWATHEFIVLKDGHSFDRVGNVARVADVETH